MFNKEKIVSRFMEYVKISSESGSEGDFHRKLIVDLDELGAEVSVDEAGSKAGADANNIYAYLKGNMETEPLIFSCHMDTVKPGKNIEPIIEDGLIKSKGDTILGSDDKSGITAIVEAVKLIKEQKPDHRPIQMIFTISEEVGLRGAKNLDYDRIIGKRCYVIDSSGPVGKIIVQAPAHNKIVSEITGKPAHAGIAPEEGISAIMAGADAISTMNLLRIDEETTANIGTFEAVGAANIVSPAARIVGEIRSLDKYKIEKQTSHMVECLRKAAEKHGAEIDIDVEKTYEPYCFHENDDIVKYAMEKCKRIGVEPFTSPSGGGSDANVLNTKGIKTINLGCGVNNAHTTDESIEINELVNITKLVYYLMLDL